MQENLENEIASQVDRLVTQAIGGDANAFGKIYDLHIDRIYRHIYYRVGNKEDAEDLTQQVFLNAWKAIASYKKKASPILAWLMRISHNSIINYYRSRRKDKDYLDTEITARDIESNPEKLAELKSDQKQLRAFILQLTPEQQQVIIMSFIEGFTNKEVAAALGKKEGAIRVIQYRALRKIRGMMSRESG